MAKIKKIIRENLPIALGAYHFLLAWSAAKLHGKPSKKIFVIGITGTKGKTTTLEILNAILETAGKKTALLSSLRVKIGDEIKKNPTGNSMPGRGFIQKFLRRAVNNGCNYALIEVTSQGVVAHRHRFVDWNMGVLTNLHPEHIESHGSFENYRAAKLDFLKYVLVRGGKVFLNEDDSNFPFFNEALMNAKTTPYAMRGDTLANYLPHESATHAASGNESDATPKFVFSDFNKSNVACAIAIAKEIGIGDQIIQTALKNFEGVPGRLNVVQVDGYKAVVDYAHTPDSLEAAYKAAREMLSSSPLRGEGREGLSSKNSAKLICILGAAGGGRDVWKRPEFGKIAEKYCDQIILTEEDPYDEKPEVIISQIKSGFSNLQPPTSNLHEIPNRRDAIRLAVQLARPGDVVIGTGKGSEDWIHYARGKKSPWNEKTEFENALIAKKENPESLKIEIIAPAPFNNKELELPWM